MRCIGDKAILLSLQRFLFADIPQQYYSTTTAVVRTSYPGDGDASIKLTAIFALKSGISAPRSSTCAYCVIEGTHQLLAFVTIGDQQADLRERKPPEFVCGIADELCEGGVDI